jgi:hypothetical protein
MGLVLALLGQPATPLLLAQTDDDPPEGEGRILGEVIGPDGSKLAGATIIAYHLSTEEVFRSLPTDGKGHFELAELPYGYFDVAVQTDDGLFVADQVVNVPPSGKATMNMTLVAGTTSDTPPRGFAGLDTPATGVARVDAKQHGGSFWKSSKGIAVLGGVGAAVLLAIALSGNDDEQPVSPITPAAR